MSFDRIIYRLTDKRIPAATGIGLVGDILDIPSNKKLHSTSVAVQAVERIKRIYHEEGLLRNCTADERYKERQKIIKPLIDEFFAWLEPLPVSGKNKLAEAIGYAINEMAYSVS